MIHWQTTTQNESPSNRLFRKGRVGRDGEGGGRGRKGGRGGGLPRQSLLIYHLVAAAGASSPPFSILPLLLSSPPLVPVLPVNAIKSANGIAANGRSVVIQLLGTIYRHNCNLSKVEHAASSAKPIQTFPINNNNTHCSRVSAYRFRFYPVQHSLRTSV